MRNSMSFTYKYERPALTVDCVVFGLDEKKLKILLIQRGLEPFKGKWALPGGFVHVGESLDAAAKRELLEETSVDKIFLEQLYTFGAPDRDPREHIVSVVYYALVNLSEHKPKADTDASNAEWFDIDDIPKLAFDHKQIFVFSIDRLRGKLRYQPIGFELLPRKFTLSQLQHLYEIVLNKEIDKRNFRKKILKMDILKDLDEIQKAVAHRAAKLYSFDKKKYNALLKKGFNFEI